MTTKQQKMKTQREETKNRAQRFQEVNDEIKRKEQFKIQRQHDIRKFNRIKAVNATLRHKKKTFSYVPKGTPHQKMLGLLKGAFKKDDDTKCMSTPFNRDLKPIIVTKKTKIQLKVKQTNFDKMRNIKFATETPMPKDNVPLLDALYDSTTLEDMKKGFERESDNLNGNGLDWFGRLRCALHNPLFYNAPQANSNDLIG